MIVIVGESASGKSSVADYLSKEFGYEKVVTYTTRKPRDYEVDGKDYHFISEEEYNSLKSNGFFAEVAEYNGWKYGSAKKDYSNNKVIVLTPRGLRSVRKSGIKNTFSVYINVPRRDRLISCLKRNDNIEEAYRRSLSDVGQFDGIEDEVDYTISNPDYKMSISTLGIIIDLEYKKFERN